MFLPCIYNLVLPGPLPAKADVDVDFGIPPAFGGKLSAFLISHVHVLVRQAVERRRFVAKYFKVVRSPHERVQHSCKSSIGIEVDRLFPVMLFSAMGRTFSKSRLSGEAAILESI